MDLENNPDVSTFVWNRPDVLKLYFKALDNRDFSVGEKFTWAGQFGIGMFIDNSYY